MPLSGHTSPAFVSWAPVAYAALVACENEVSLTDLRWDLYSHETLQGFVPAWMPRHDNRLLVSYAIAVPATQLAALERVGRGAADLFWRLPSPFAINAPLNFGLEEEPSVFEWLPLLALFGNPKP